MPTHDAHPPPLLVAEDLTIRRRGRTILSDASLAVPAGEHLLVSGPNGAGKTTLLRALAGVTAPSAGRLRRPAPPHVYVPAGLSPAPAHTVGTWWAGMRRLRGLPAADVPAELAAAGLDPALAGRPLAALSRGQSGRVALAEAIGVEAGLVVLDEPFAGLDGAGSRWLAQALAARLSAGAVVVVADHGGAARELLPAGRELRLGAALAAQDGDRAAGDGLPAVRDGHPAAGNGRPAEVTITAVDPHGRRRELPTTRAARDATLAELLRDGWAVEQVRTR